MAEYVCGVSTKYNPYGEFTDYELRERVVRCRDCRWCRTGNLSGTPVCMRLFELVEIDVPVSARVSPDGFCWHGQERDADGRD